MSVHNFELHQAISEDIASGWIWVETQDPALTSKLDARRRVARVSHGTKAVFCEVLYANDFDLRRFNHFYLANGIGLLIKNNQIVRAERVFINHWYRRKLGIDSKAGQHIELGISTKWNPHAEARACIQHHPQVAVRIGAWLGVVALGLGLLGVGLAAFPFAEPNALLANYSQAVRVTGVLFVALGLVAPGWATFLLIKARS
jgi:hypothetical protein